MSVIESLGLEEVTLGGFSMGGTIAIRYMARHSGARVRKLALFAAAAPVWIKRPDFPQAGLDRAAVDDLIKQCRTDRPLLMAEFGKIFFRSEDAVSPPLANWFFDLNMQALPHATAACLELLRDSDLRPELGAVKVPTVIFHGWQDKICPFGLAEVMSRGIAGAEVIPFEHSGHGLFYEEKEKFNAALAAFAA
jgi:non-heme chloroperoxidase